MDRLTHLEFPSSSREKERESIPMNEDCLNLAICCILYVQRQTYSNFSFTDLISPKLYERSLYWIGCAWVEWERWWIGLPASSCPQLGQWNNVLWWTSLSSVGFVCLLCKWSILLNGQESRRNKSALALGSFVNAKVVPWSAWAWTGNAAVYGGGRGIGSGGQIDL